MEFKKILIWGLPKTASETCSFTWTALLKTYTCGSNWYICFSLCIIIHSFDCQYSLRFYWYCYNQNQSSGTVLQKRCSYKFRKINKKTPKKRFWHWCFLVSFAKFLKTSFSKNPSDGCFIINTRSVYCPTTAFRLFKNNTTNIFCLSIFFWLTCRLGTRVSSIFQALSQKPIFNPVEHLRWSFFPKIVNSLKSR